MASLARLSSVGRRCRAAREAQRSRRQQHSTTGGSPAATSSTKRLSKKHDELAREQADMQARGTIGYVMQEKAEAPIAFVLNRGEYDQRKEQVTPATPAMLPPFPDDLPRNRLGLREVAVAARASADGARHGQSLLEEVFGTGSCERRATSASRANCRRIPNCSIGWPSSSANRAGT